MSKITRRQFLQVTMIAGAVLALRTPPAVAALAVSTAQHKRGYIPFVFPFEFEREEKPNGRHLENSR